MNYSRRTKISTTTGLRQIKILNLGARIGSHTRGGGAQFQRIALLLVWLPLYGIAFSTLKGARCCFGDFLLLARETYFTRLSFLKNIT
jgi:hypothetical protein